MDVKEAARTAKSYLNDLFSDEQVTNVGLEEVEFDELDNVWKITVGFSRPWDRRVSIASTLSGEATRAGRSYAGRSYKVVRIKDDDGTIESLRDRLLANPKGS